jgi:large subunit ribosomal protein L16
MFIPKKSKFKKQQKGKFFNRVSAVNNFNQLKFGSIGLKAMSFSRLSSKQIETIKKLITKQMKKMGRLIIHPFPNTPISHKPIEIRMGKGKGNIDHWVYKIKPGYILCEIVTDQTDFAHKVLISLIKKMNIKARIVIN